MLHFSRKICQTSNWAVSLIPLMDIEVFGLDQLKPRNINYMHVVKIRQRVEVMAISQS